MSLFPKLSDFESFINNSEVMLEFTFQYAWENCDVFMAE